MSQLKWIPVGVLAGLAVPSFIMVPKVLPPLHGGFVLAWLIALVWLALIVFPFILPGWLAFRPHWGWWAASIGGLLIGLVGGFAFVTVVLNQTVFCFAISGGSGQFCREAFARDNASILMVVVAPLLMMGLAQALTLRSSSRRIGWGLTTAGGAFVFPYGYAIMLLVSGQLPNHLEPFPAYLAALPAGTAWGIVIGVGLSLLVRPPRLTVAVAATA